MKKKKLKKKIKRLNRKIRDLECELIDLEMKKMGESVSYEINRLKNQTYRDQRVKLKPHVMLKPPIMVRYP